MRHFPDIFIGKKANELIPKSRFGEELIHQYFGEYSIYYNNQDPINFHFSVDDSHLIILCGEVYSYREIHSIAKSELNFKQITIDIKNNSFNPNELNGHYLLLYINKQESFLNLFTNRLGTFHCYYQENQLISTNFRSIVDFNVKQEVDITSLKYFVKYGFFVNDSTYYTNIKVVPPSTKLSFNSSLELIAKEKYHSWSYKPNKSNFETNLIEYDKLMNLIMSDLLEVGEVAVPISGGLDSRNTYAVASRISSKIKTYSYGLYKGNPETKIANQLSNARGIKLFEHVTTNYLFERLNDIIASVEGYQYIDGTRQTDISGWLELNSTHVIAAHWGDVWNDSMGYELGYEPYAFAEKKFLKKGYEKVYKIMGWDDDLKNPFIDELKKYIEMSNGDIDFAIKMLKTYQWSHRWTMASVRAFQLGAFPRLPYYDNRIFDFFMTVDINHVKNRSLQIEHLKTYHSDLAKIKWQEYDANLFYYKIWNNRNLLYRITNKLKRLLIGEPIQRNWQIFYLNPTNKNKLIELFSTDERKADFLKDFNQNPTGANGYALSVLLTLHYNLYAKA